MISQFVLVIEKAIVCNCHCIPCYIPPSNTVGCCKNSHGFWRQKGRLLLFSLTQLANWITKAWYKNSKQQSFPQKNKNLKFCKMLCLFALWKCIPLANEKIIQDTVPVKKGLKNNPVSNHYKNLAMLLSIQNRPSTWLL